MTSLWGLVERRAHETPDALLAVDAMGRELSFAAYRCRAERVAAGLARIGAAQGSVVAWMLPTSLDALVVTAALARLGAVQAPLLTAYRHRELRFVLRQTGAHLLLVPNAFRSFDYETMARDIAADLGGVRVLPIADALPEGDPALLPPPDDGDAVGAPIRWLYYTSGTTADPKGARHTDATLHAAAMGLVRAFELRADDREAIVFPVTHVGGALWLIASLVSGATAIVVDVWSREAIDVLARQGVTQAGASTVFHQAYLAAQRERPGVPLFPRVRAFPGGGAPKPPALHYEVKRELGGVGIVSGYGLTECPAVTMNHVRDPDDKLAHTEGRPSPEGARVRIVKADGTEAARGEEGEVRVLGPQLFRGYVDASLDADAFDEQGFFCTGDLGVLDADGYLSVTGRLKDIIIRKGENISAKEIEDLLYLHPKVREVAVIGLVDPDVGERCCAVVVPHDAGAPPDLGELAAFLIARGLMKQKTPERLELVPELPRNANGKIAKRDLRSRFGP